MMVKSSIFRAYDIRGIYPKDLNEKTAYQIGRAFAVYLKENVSLRDISRREKILSPEKVVVGRDARSSSPILARSFIDGLTNEGINVWDIGTATVDVVYFASGKYHLPAAMVTASHNPEEWNGFKLMKSNVEFFPPKDLCPYVTSPVGREITISFVRKSDDISKKGEITHENIKENYLKHIFSFINVDAIRPMRIVVNSSSDAVNLMLKPVLEKLPIDYVTKKGESDLKYEITSGHYHFGCSFDTDGDRVVFIDENGELVNPSIIGAIMVRHFLKKRQYGKVVYGADVSKIVPDVVSAYNGEPIREKVGHTYISSRLKEVDGIIGIESSGHYYLKDNFYADSGIISFLIMLEILSGQKKSLSTLVLEFSKYFSIPEITFSTKGGSASDEKVINQEEFIKNIAQNFEGYNLDWLDGLTVTTSDFWLNLRSSNTETLVRLNIEARDEIILNRVKQDLISLIEKALSVL